MSEGRSESSRPASTDGITRNEAFLREDGPRRQDYKEIDSLFEK